MKVVILAGGFGTRISEESHLKPKPMVEIGGMPILWHIMKIYSHYGLNDFIICCGYKGYYIKEYFANYLLHMSDVTIDLQNSTIETHKNSAEPWRISLVDTGLETGTAGRLQKIKPYLDDTFCMTYGDGVGDVDITALLDTHKKSASHATVTGIDIAARFGSMVIENSKVKKFKEKPRGNNKSLVNGGFFVLEPTIFDFIGSEREYFENGPLEKLSIEKQLSVYQHDGFWSAMDTLKDQRYLEGLWQSGKAPWKVWT